MSTTPTEPLRPLSDAELLATAQYLLAASLRVGDLVDYSPLIGESPPQLAIMIDGGPYGPTSDGHWTVRLQGIGDVTVLAVRLNRRVEEGIIADMARRENENRDLEDAHSDLEDAHKALTEAGAPTSDRGLALTVGGRIRMLGRRQAFACISRARRAPTSPGALSDTDLANWASGRPNNPTTRQGVLMALELQQLRAAAERAVTIADEAFGTGPVEPVDSTLGRLERGIFDQRKLIVELETDFRNRKGYDLGWEDGYRARSADLTSRLTSAPRADLDRLLELIGNAPLGWRGDQIVTMRSSTQREQVAWLKALVSIGEAIEAALPVDQTREPSEPIARQSGPRATQQGAATPGQGAIAQGAVPAAGNVAEPQIDPTPDRVDRPSLSGDYVEAKGEGIAAAFREFLCALGEGMNQLLPPGHERTRAAFHLEEAARAITSNWPGSAR